MCNTERIIRHCIQEKVALTLVVNKVDRLILELKLPPTDAYFKLKHTIEEVNTIIAQTPGGEGIRLSPELGNVSFASSQMGWCFTLKSFAKLYADSFRKCSHRSFFDDLAGIGMLGNCFGYDGTALFISLTIVVTCLYLLNVISWSGH